MKYLYFNIKYHYERTFIPSTLDKPETLPPIIVHFQETLLVHTHNYVSLSVFSNFNTVCFPVMEVCVINS